jgi:hypothetical protein
MKNSRSRLLLAGCLFLSLIVVASAETKRIYVIPPTQWDNKMSLDRPALMFSPSDLANLTGGIAFGQSPADVNAKLPSPTPGIDWVDLPFANEFPNDVRYFWVRLDATRELRAGITGCTGANSYIVFLFRNRALFRISWRLLTDNDCPSTRAAAEDIYARYMAIDRTISLATHYRPGKADAVEITDPNADDLIPYRWANRERR